MYARTHQRENQLQPEVALHADVAAVLLDDGGEEHHAQAPRHDEGRGEDDALRGLGHGIGLPRRHVCTAFWHCTACSSRPNKTRTSKCGRGRRSGGKKCKKKITFLQTTSRADIIMTMAASRRQMIVCRMRSTPPEPQVCACARGSALGHECVNAGARVHTRKYARVCKCFGVLLARVRARQCACACLCACVRVCVHPNPSPKPSPPTHSEAPQEHVEEIRCSRKCSRRSDGTGRPRRFQRCAAGTPERAMSPRPSERMSE
jgi:hypothetical protein